LQEADQPVVLQLFSDRSNKDGRQPASAQIRSSARATAKWHLGRGIKALYRNINVVPHILIVDDDVAVSKTLARMLALAGHEVTQASSAEIGLQAAAERQPAAILVDLRMPNMTGIEFLRRLRQDAGLREVPVALITGDYFLESPMLAEIKALGATVHYKPLWLDDITQLAKRLTDPKT
jgi:CheY-like chemotaxis protein